MPEINLRAFFFSFALAVQWYEMRYFRCVPKLFPFECVSNLVYGRPKKGIKSEQQSNACVCVCVLWHHRSIEIEPPFRPTTTLPQPILVILPGEG